MFSHLGKSVTKLARFIISNVIANCGCFTCFLVQQSGRNTVILQQTYAFQEKAVTVDSDNPAYLSELGYELLLQNRPRDAERCFNNALKIDESSLFTLTGGIQFQLHCFDGCTYANLFKDYIA